MMLYDVGMINAGHGLKRNDTAPKLKMKPEKSMVPALVHIIS